MTTYLIFEKRGEKWLNTFFSSKDFYLSSFLLVNDCKLLDNLVEDGVTSFVFEMIERVKKIIGNYYSLRSRVEPGIFSSYSYFEECYSRFKIKFKIK